MASKMPPRRKPEDEAPEKDEDALTVPEDLSPSPTTPEPGGRDRRGLAAHVALDPNSLGGSYFHRIENGEIAWEGVIAAEISAPPAPIVYLCVIDKGLPGAERVRVSIPVALEQMIWGDDGYEFRFYDTEEERSLAAAAIRAAEVPIDIKKEAP